MRRGRYRLSSRQEGPATPPSSWAGEPPRANPAPPTRRAGGEFPAEIAAMMAPLPNSRRPRDGGASALPGGIASLEDRSPPPPISSMTWRLATPLLTATPGPAYPGRFNDSGPPLAAD